MNIHIYIYIYIYIHIAAISMYKQRYDIWVCHMSDSIGYTTIGAFFNGEIAEKNLKKGELQRNHP